MNDQLFLQACGVGPTLLSRVDIEILGQAS